MRNIRIPLPIGVVLTTLLTLPGISADAHAQTTVRRASQPSLSEDARRNSEAEARARWAPTRRSTQKRVSQTDAAHRPAIQPKQSQHVRAARPKSRQSAESRKTQVRQAAHQIPSPPPTEIIEGPVVYEPAIVDGACDTIGASCGCGEVGCDAIGCDSIGSCGPNCGCSMCGELVGDRAWRPALTLSLPQDGWVSVEAMNMWQDALATPALLTTSPNGTARQDAGVLPGGRVLFGGDDVLDDTLDGIRVRFGIWLDRCHTVGLGAEYFELGELTQQYSQTSTGDPILARPFFNTLTGREDSELIAFPEVVSGTATVDVRSALYGGGFHVRRLRGCEEGCREWLFCGCKGHFCTRSEFRLGYRYLQLEEGVSIREELVSNDTSNPGTFDITDRFNTINQFNGVDLGWSHRIVRGYWTLEGLVRIAVGNTRQEVEIAGSTLINDPNDPPAQSYDEGFLALETNSGTHTQDEFSVVPEFDLILGYQLTDHLKATFGYTGLYWSNVVRPGHHIPTMLNPDNLPPDVASNGAPRPQFAFDTTDYWIHGLTYGLEYRW